jgi:putative FmdB family regulatory protein
MPLLEFECRSCSHRFEELVRGSESASCPRCGAKRLRRLLSGFGVGTPAPPSRGPGGCGSCGDPRGPGACGRG